MAQYNYQSYQNNNYNRFPIANYNNYNRFPIANYNNYNANGNQQEAAWTYGYNQNQVEGCSISVSLRKNDKGYQRYVGYSSSTISNPNESYNSDFDYSSDYSQHQVQQRYYGPFVNMNQPRSSNYRIACYTCGEEFQDRPSLFAHKYKAHNTRNYYCPICNKQFSVMSEMKVHESTHEIHACEHCPETFKFQDSLIAHLKHAHTERNVEVTLNNCRNDKSSNFNSPVAASTPAPSFSETSQDVDVKSQDSGIGVKMESLNSVKTESLNSVKTESFNCDKCIKTFETSDKLTAHFKVHTDVDKVSLTSLWPSQPNDQLCCPYCIKKFTQRRDLHLHLNSAHTQMFYCPKCPAEYTTKEELEAHSKVHA